MRPAAILVVLGIASTLVAVPSSGAADRSDPRVATVRTEAAPPALTDPAPCPDEPDFTCSTLRVPLDHTGGVAGTLDLSVAASNAEDAPRGVLLLLTGGPGQPGVSLLTRVKKYFDPAVLDEYRLVVFDQRGTGAGAIDCPALQESTGGSDFLTPPPDAVRACAKQLGRSRDFYSSVDTVRDIDLLRRALGADSLSLDGISYGTYTAEHYALRYPARVTNLVIDSVVPQQGFDTTHRTAMRASGRVLRSTCADDPACHTRPARDLAWLVRHGTIDGESIGGSALLESLSIMSLNTINPSMDQVAGALHRARYGDPELLGQILGAATSIGTPADQLSAGLHLDTVCADQRFPWGDSSAPLRGRERIVDKTLAGLPTRSFGPFDRATAKAALPIAGCLDWPRTRPAPYTRRTVIRSRALVLAGERDLFTPVGWARAQARRMPRASTVVVHEAGHGVQTDPIGRSAVREFLLR